MSSSVKEAKKKFPLHKQLVVYVKENPVNLYDSVMFDNIIRKSNYPAYSLYIHDDYITLWALNIPNAEPIKLIIDDKLWEELYNIFDVQE